MKNDDNFEKNHLELVFNYSEEVLLHLIKPLLWLFYFPYFLFIIPPVKLRLFSSGGAAFLKMSSPKQIEYF